MKGRVPQEKMGSSEKEGFLRKGRIPQKKKGSSEK